MQINTNLSPQASAKPRWQEQRAQQIVHANANPRWQEQRANKRKLLITSTCKAPMARAACTTKFKHLQNPDGRSSMQINTDISLQALQSPDGKSSMQITNLSQQAGRKAPMARAACTTNASIWKAPMVRAA